MKATQEKGRSRSHQRVYTSQTRGVGKRSDMGRVDKSA